MLLEVSKEQRLFHKYLGEVIVTEIDDNGILADTKARGVLDFKYSDFGRLLYYSQDHSNKSFNTIEEYVDFCHAYKKQKEEDEKKSIDLRNEREKKDRIEEILERRNIKSFIHFTRIENLDSILKFGLVPVSIQQSLNLCSIHNDLQRIESQLDCTSCSIGFPNYKLFYDFRKNKYPETKWIVIEISSDILFLNKNTAYYCETNAARVLPKTPNISKLCSASSLENMFSEYVTTKEGIGIRRIDLKIDNSKTTDPQAEILIRDIIHPRYIERICFRNQEDINEYIMKNGAELLSKFEYQTQASYFKPRNDYEFWKKE